ncbi:MAG: paraquat-inducible protein A [Rhodospirillaceae bacterium]|nr:paraquat-inducible protein A [Rhodospirillaceae bacterium]MEA4836852.1 paraquat-inducible protein A [Rhodospirillaceae bacterium]
MKRIQPVTMLTASDLGMVACEYCALVVQADENGHHPDFCPRCGGRLHSRHTQSLQRCWAFLIAAAILYIPANILPIMRTSSLFSGAEDDTIMTGIVYFWTSGSIGLAALIFTASILVPMLKLFSLAFLTISVQRRWRYSLGQRMILFRIVEGVGRWSMLDVFVVALMVGLVQFHALAEIKAGPGAAAFGGVVVLTMLASKSFDARLIWDNDPRISHDR